MKKIFAVLALSALLVPALAVPAFAQDHGPGRGGPGDHDRGGPGGPGPDRNGPGPGDHRGPPPGAQNRPGPSPAARPAARPAAVHHDNRPNVNRAANNNRRFDSRDWKGWRGSDRDIRSFRTTDYSTWRKGRWYHGNHGGRDGWFWIVGNIFYPYADRVAVIPDPYVPYQEIGEYGDGYWYYCGDPEGYYPYVSECYVPWRAVAQ